MSNRNAVIFTMAGCVACVCGVLAYSVIWYINTPTRLAQKDQAVINRPYENALERRTIETLKDFGIWLKENNAAGYVGEFGWPGNESDQWETIAYRWYETAQYYNVWTTQWASSSWWPDAYRLSLYNGTPSRGLYELTAQSVVLERSIYLYNSVNFGVNVAGMEFGDNATAKIPGVANTDYFYEPEQSFAYLASRGISLIRVPFKWERIQPELGGPLNQTEVAAIKTVLGYAEQHTIRVIIDMHNYGRYNTGDETHVLGESDEFDNAFVDAWERLSDELSGQKALIGYDIMNEPHDLQSGKQETPAQHWEELSQRVVNAIRAMGDTTLVLIPGYDWSMANWRLNHSRAWIDDPAGNIRYEAHQYWDSDASGKYLHPYQYELDRANEM